MAKCLVRPTCLADKSEIDLGFGSMAKYLVGRSLSVMSITKAVGYEIVIAKCQGQMRIWDSRIWQMPFPQDNHRHRSHNHFNSSRNSER